MLDYFKDTLSNVGLYESLLEWGFYDVTQVENKCVKRESNQIRENWVKSSYKPWVESNRK